jgi:cell division protein FtsL
MALEGSLKDFGLADILQLIYFQRKTGVLSLDSKSDKVKLLFIEGNISGAESKRRKEDNRLGKILLKKGYINDEDLKSVLEEQRRTGAKMGAVLVKNTLVDREIIRDILNNQITETVVQLFGWKQGTYEFMAQGVAQDREFPFSLDTQHLLMDGLRIVDELSLIKDRITLDTLFVRKDDIASGLTEQEKEILDCVDGENDVSTIIDLTGMDNFVVSRTLLSLMEKEVIETLEAPPVLTASVSVRGESSAVLKLLFYGFVVASLVMSFALVFMQRDDTLKVFTASKKIRDLRFSIEAYGLKNKSYPAALSSISGEPDPWGSPYVYTVSGSLFSLKSVGPDKIRGTGDDIY